MGQMVTDRIKQAIWGKMGTCDAETLQDLAERCLAGMHEDQLNDVLHSYRDEDRQIKLPCFGIVVALTGDGGGTISSDKLKEVCPHCESYDCCYSCDGSVASFQNTEAPNTEGDSEEDVRGRIACNGAMDGILAKILADACAGIDIGSLAYIEGIETSIEQSGNNT